MSIILFIFIGLLVMKACHGGGHLKGRR